jgi:hypothetical protein
MARTSVIETESPEWHSGARPSSYVRMWWWVTLESNQAGTKAQALQARSVPRLDVTLEVGCRPRGRTGLNAAYETAWIPNRSACDKECRGCKLPSGAGVRPAWRDLLWRRAEDPSLTPCGAIGVRSRAGAPVRLTLQNSGAEALIRNAEAPAAATRRRRRYFSSSTSQYR